MKPTLGFNGNSFLGFVVFFVRILKVEAQDDTEIKTNEVIRMESLFIRAETISRYSRVSIATEVLNSASADKEMNYEVQLPEDAFITTFSMKTENETLFGVIRERKEADEAYNEAKEQGQSAAQVKYSTKSPERNRKFFSVVLNVIAKSEATFELQYEEMLTREHGYYTQRIRVEPGQVVSNITVMATYEDESTIESFLYSVPNENNIPSEFHKDSTQSVQLLAGINSRSLLFSPRPSSQGTSGLQGDIVIRYDVERSNDGGLIQIQDNAFVHHFAPSGLLVMKKNIVFVIDVSGSMGGHKIAQVREAMVTILNRLRHDDMFNIVVFSSKSQQWKVEPILASRSNVNAALAFCQENLKAGGGTNIMSGLETGLSLLNNFARLVKQHGNMVVFLTDGMPTAGITNLSKIIEKTTALNSDKCSIYCLGFGNDVDIEFLKKIALSNYGKAFRIYDDDEEDADKQLEEFFKTIENVLLSQLTFNYPPEVVALDSLTASEFKYYFEGSELIVSGLVKSNVSTTDISKYDVIVQGSGQDGVVSYDIALDHADKLDGAPKGYIKRLWSFMKIKELLDKALVSKGTMGAYYTEKALNMSLEYGFVTPLTSMVVTKQLHAQVQNNFKNEMSMSFAGIQPLQSMTRSKIKKVVNTAHQTNIVMHTSAEDQGCILRPFELSVLLIFCCFSMFLVKFT